jgi:hypothetical protein
MADTPITPPPDCRAGKKIYFLPNQSLLFHDKKSQECCIACEEPEYCKLVNTTDPVYYQFRQVPCGCNLLCWSNPDEDCIDCEPDPLPENKVIDPAFNTVGIPDWTRNAAVAWSGFAANWHSVDKEGTLYQALDLDPCKTYRINVTMFSYLSGSVKVYLYDKLIAELSANGS